MRKLAIAVCIGLMFLANAVSASEKGSKGSMMGRGEGLVEVGNKICPVSGEEIGGMGKGVEVVYKGKTYMLCCAACKKDFDRNPEKFIKNIEK